jgi:copper transport protein
MSSEPLPGWWRPPIAVGGVALALTPALTGHAHTGDLTALAVPADVIHILAMSLWLGGLAALTYAVFPGHDVGELRDAVPRFSRLAFACVGALVVTGSFQGWRQVGSIDALRNTTYGQLLVVKVVIVAVLVVFGALSRQIVGYLFAPQAPDPDDRELHDERLPVVAGGAGDEVGTDEQPDDWELDEAFEYRRLRRSVLAEVVIAIAIIVVTTLLVDAVPAKVANSAPVGGATGVTLKSNQVWVDITAAPGLAPGANDLHVTAISPAGAPVNPVDLTATLDYPSRHIAPLTIPLRKLGPGHYLSPGFTIPFKGTWRITANVKIDAFTEITLPGTLVIN